MLIEANTKVTTGKNDAVYLSSPATKAEAYVLGKSLQDDGYFQDKGFAVTLAKQGNGQSTVGFVLKEGAWDQRDTVELFETIGRSLAPSPGGFPIRIQLDSDRREVKRELIVGKFLSGTKDFIYYQGDATESDASTPAGALKQEGFFRAGDMRSYFPSSERRRPSPW